MQANLPWSPGRLDALKSQPKSLSEGQLPSKAKPIPEQPKTASAPLPCTAEQQNGHGRPGQAKQLQTAVEPPTAKLPALPVSPFSSMTAVKGELEGIPSALQDASHFAASNQTKFQWPDSPRQSYSEGEFAGMQVSY